MSEQHGDATIPFFTRQPRTPRPTAASGLLEPRRRWRYPLFLLRLMASILISLTPLPITVLLPPTAFLAPSTAAAAGETFVVNSTADAVDATPGDGVCATAGSVCTLRAAIQEANALAGAQTITFDAALNGTPITLTISGTGTDSEGDLRVAGDVTITGNGVDNTIIQACTVSQASGACSGTGIENRLFDFASGTSAMSNLTLRHGRSTVAGGAISVGGSGTLTLTNTKLTLNMNTGAGGGGAVYTTGTVTIVDSTVSGNATTSQDAGGVHNFGTLTVRGSTISDNSAPGAGGGIKNGATLTISNSTISGNSANSGGGLDTDTSTLNATNITIAGNTANSTFGGGLRASFGASGSITNSIVAGNTGNNCNTTVDVTSSYNLSSDASCGFTGTGDQESADPMLGALADNGGPTMTRALQAGSDAIDAGNNTVCAAAPVNNLDQRGTTRPQGTTCDIGAYEYQAPASNNADLSALSISSGDIGTFDYDDTSYDAGTVGSSISSVTVTATKEDANATMQVRINGGSFNNLSSGVPSGSLSLSSGANTIEVKVTAEDTTTIKTYSISITRSSTANYVVNTTADTHDANPNNGACADSSGDCSLRAAIEEANPSSGGPKTIGLPAGTYNLTLGELEITKSINIDGAGAASTTISGNDTSRVLKISAGSGTISGVTITDGSVSDGGGGVRIVHTSGKTTNPTLSNMTIDGNTATNLSRGGGLYVEASTSLTVTGVTITNNTATDENNGGAGIYNLSNNLSITDSTISNNSANGGRGGALYNNGGTVTITTSTISFNDAHGGAGIRNENSGTVTVKRSLMRNNAATSGGGGALMSDAGTTHFYNSTITGNSASSGAGGGIYTSNATTTLTNVTMSHNTAPGFGNGDNITINSSTLTATNTIIRADAGEDTCAGGTFTSGGHNISSDSSCNFTQSSDRQGYYVPFFGLSDYGGPTETFDLQPTNWAINGGDATVCASANVGNVDQRGTVRPQHGVCDIGAVEFNGDAPTKLIITAQPSSASAAPGTFAVTVEAWNNSNVVRQPLQPTTVQLSVVTGTGTLGGTTSGTFTNPNNSLTISDVTYDAAESGVVLRASTTAGDSLTAGDSNGITFTADYTVNSTADAVDATPGDGTCATAGSVCTLRAAIQEANASAGAQSISLPAGTYTLSIGGAGEDAAATGDLDVLGDTKIFGGGAASTIIQAGASAAAGIDRVFDMGTISLTLSGVTVRHGNGSTFAGGITNWNTGGSLTVKDSIIADNIGSQGAGIYSQGALNVLRTTVSGNTATENAGGGIQLNGSSAIATISRSAIVNNTVGYGSGGAIALFSGATLTLANSTASGNVNTDGGWQGAIFGNGVTLTVINSTIANNTSPNNVGGIATFSSTVLMRNSIVAGNSDSQCYVGSGSTFTSQGYNLSSDASCNFNNEEADDENTDPELGALGTYGTATYFHPLLSGSPAIDAGFITYCVTDPVSAVDQRGVARPQGAACDIGAHEAIILPASKLAVTDITPDSPNTAPYTFAVTVQAQDSNSIVSPVTAATTVTLTKKAGSAAAGTLGGTVSGVIPAGGTSVTISGITWSTGESGVELTATASGGDTLTADDTDAFTVQAVQTFTVNTTDDTYDNANGNGICADSNGNCSLRAAVDEAKAFAGAQIISVPAGTYLLSLGLPLLAWNGPLALQGAGAGSTIIDGGDFTNIFNVAFSGDLMLSGLTLRNGNATGSGGAIIVFSGTGLTVTNSAFEDNTSTSGYGGAISTESPTTITNTTFTGNTAVRGGALQVQTASITITNSTFSNNMAEAGGALQAGGNGGAITITGSTFTGNTATHAEQGGGGAVFAVGPTTITNGTFSNNTSAQRGGALEAQSDTHPVAITGSTFNGNSSTYQGGGITVGGPTTITNSTITGNTGDGAIHLANTSSVTTLLNTTIANNISRDNGNQLGAIGGWTTYTTLKNTIVSGTVDLTSAPYHNCSGSAMTSQGNNLSSDDTCAFTEDGDLENADPLLVALASNGGPTQTMALGAGSPAINAGTNTGCPATDQRGTARPIAGICDIGAFEASINPATKLAITAITPVSPTKPPTGPATFSVTVAALDASSGLGFVSQATQVTLTKQTGAGTLGGTLTGTIPASGTGVTITGVTYDTVENGIVLTASSTGGDTLTAGNSAGFNVVNARVFTVNSTPDTSDTTAGDGLCDSDSGTAGDQCTLRAAVEEANAGAGYDVISVPAGSYTIGSDLNITAPSTTVAGPGIGTGVARAIIEAGNVRRPFSVRANGVRIEGLDLRKNDVQGPIIQVGDDQDDVEVQGTQIVSNAFAGGNRAVSVNDGASGVLIQGNVIKNADDSAISFRAVSNSTVQGNTITNSGGGIELTPNCCWGEVGSDNNQILNNRILGSRQHGIRLYDSDNNTISGNVVAGGLRGGNLGGCCGEGQGPGAIELSQGADNNTVTGNLVAGNAAVGIKVGTGGGGTASTGNTVTGNYVADNGTGGIRLNDQSSGTTVHRNTLIDNQYLGESGGGVPLVASDGQAFDNGTGNVWHAMVSGVDQGNFYSDYTGVDTTPADGIGDETYGIAGSAASEDPYPLMTAGAAPTSVMTLAPFSAIAGGTATARGIGYPGGGPVSVTFNGSEVATATAGAGGSVDVPFTVPAGTAPGTYTVTMTGGATSNSLSLLVVTQTTFSVNSTADVSDANLGDSVCDSDTGTAGEQCTLRAAVEEASARGGFTTINVPAGNYLTVDPVPTGCGCFTLAPDSGATLVLSAPGIAVVGPGTGAGVPRAIIGTGTRTERVFSVEAPGGRIEGFELRMTTNDANGPVVRVGVNNSLPAADGVTIKGNVSSGGERFVAVNSMTANSLIEDNVVSRTEDAAIALAGALNVTVRNNTIDGGSAGIELKDSDASTATNNTIQGNYILGVRFHGIRLDEATGNTITGNVIAGSTAATGNDGEVPGAGAIELQRGSNNNTISGNMLAGNGGVGIKIGTDSGCCPPTPSTGNTVTGNHIAGNGNGGIRLNATAENNTIHRNTLLDNGFSGAGGGGPTLVAGNGQAYDNGSGNVWHAVVESVDQGNHYSDYTGVDTTPADGIGDEAYAIAGPAGSEDPLPRMTAGAAPASVLAVKPLTGIVGTEVTATGFGYPASAPFTVTFNGTEVDNGTVTVGGLAKGSFAIPVGTAPGSYTVTVASGALSRSATVSVLALVTFNVNSESTEGDADPGDGVCDAAIILYGIDEVCTLQAAIDEANARGGFATINVPAGAYTVDEIEITGDFVTITGPGLGGSRAMLESEGTRAFLVHGDSVTIQGLDISANDNCCSGPIIRVGGDNEGIIVSGVQILGNALHNGYKGVAISRGSHDNTLSGNEVYGNDDDGIWLHDASSNTISNNIVHDNGTGIDMEDASNNVVQGNTVLNSGERGINLEGGSSNQFTGNSVSGSDEHGLRLEGSSNNVVQGNILTGNGQDSSNSGAIEVVGSGSGNQVLDNVVQNNAARGIKIGSDSECCSETFGTLVRGNVVSGNSGEGLRLNSGSGSSTVTRNSFINNGTGDDGPCCPDFTGDGQVIDNGEDNDWHAVVESVDKGNFYSDYDGDDANSDGIGDESYGIPGDAGSEDPKPLIEPAPLGVPLLGLYPSSGVAGGSFIAGGLGFDGVATVTVTFDSTTVGTGTPNADGEVTVNVTVPVGAGLGAHTVSMAGGGKSAGATFTVVTPTVFNVDDIGDTDDTNQGDGICEDPDTNCTLRAAVQEANAHGGFVAINVPAGTYELTNTMGSGATAHLSIEASGVSIVGPGIGDSVSRAIITMTACERGIQLSGSGSSLLGLEIHGDCGPVVRIGDAANGVTVSGVRVAGNDISEGFTGVNISPESHHNTIEDNVIHDVGSGIWVDGASDNAISDNHLMDIDAHGIQLMANDENHPAFPVDGNVITGNTVERAGFGEGGDDSGAIELARGVSGTLVASNTLRANGGHGIKVGSNNDTQPTTEDNVIRDNTIVRNGRGTGIALNVQSRNTEVYGNFVIGNRMQANDDGQGNVWHKTVSSVDTGNYWSGYERGAGVPLADSNSNGCADAPYTIPGETGGTDTCAKVIAPVTFTVNTAADTVDADLSVAACADAGSQCSLRAAIMQANQTAGPAIINVPAGVYRLSVPPAPSIIPTDDNDSTIGDLDIWDDVTIKGTGAASSSAIIQGCDYAANQTCVGIDRLVHVTGVAAVTVEKVTLRKGNTGGWGGGIYNVRGLLTVNNAVLTNNKANGGGAIWTSDGDTRVVNSTLSFNTSTAMGGAIYVGVIGGDEITAPSVLTVTGSTLNNNTATGNGGAISTEITPGENPTITVTNSTLNNNTAGGNGGAVYSIGTLDIFKSTLNNNTATGNGGAVHNGGVLRIGNSTVSANLAQNQGGGLYHAGSANADLVNVTMFGNSAATGGGFTNASAGGSLNLGNTIIAGSLLGGNCQGTFNQSGMNLSSDGTCNFANEGGMDNTDPQLGPLANNGGPTRTHLPATGSPVINVGNGTLCAGSLVNNVDQRGTARPQGPACDLGAVEATPQFFAGVDVSSVPTGWVYGETKQVTVTATNIGTQTWNFDGTNPVALRVQFFNDDNPTPVSSSVYPLAADVAAGGTATFTNISVQAPNAAADRIEFQMVRTGLDVILVKSSVNITLGAPAGGLSTVNVPTVWLPSTPMTFAVPVTNDSTVTWNATTHPRTLVRARFAGAANYTFVNLAADLPAGQSTSVNVTLTSPAALGPTQIELSLQRTVTNLVWSEQTVNVEVRAGYSGTLNPATVPATWVINKEQTFNVTATNTGGQAWATSGANRVVVRAKIGSGPYQYFDFTGGVNIGAQGTASIALTAPATPGQVAVELALWHGGTSTAFGTQTVNVTVGGPQQASITAPAAPVEFTLNKTRNLTVNVTNTGGASGATWTNSGAGRVVLRAQLGSGSFAYGELAGNVAPGQSGSATVAISAGATLGATTLHLALMLAGSGSPFATLDVNAEVISTLRGSFPNAATQVPAAWTPNQPQTFNVTVRNTALADGATWANTGGGRITVRANFQGKSPQYFELPSTVAPAGGEATVSVTLQGPPEAGATQVELALLQASTSTTLGTATKNVSVGSALQGTIHPNNIADFWTVGRVLPSGSLQVTNTAAPGGATWNNVPGPGHVVLGISVAGAATQYFQLPGSVAPGQSATVNVTNLTAVSTTGPATVAFTLSPAGQAPFAGPTNKSITVKEAYEGTVSAAGVPAQMTAGKPTAFPVQVSNTAAPTGNTWQTSGPGKVVVRARFGGGLPTPYVYTDLPLAVAPGSNTSVSVLLTPPSTVQTGLPVELAVLPAGDGTTEMDTDSANTDLVSALQGTLSTTGVPTLWTKGQSKTFTVNVTNTALVQGGTTWELAGTPRVVVRARFGGASPTPYVNFDVNASVAPGASGTATVTLTAPSATGSPPLELALVVAGPNTVLHSPTAVSTSIRNGYEASVSSTGVPTSWTANETKTFSVTVTNIGSETWTPAGANSVVLQAKFINTGTSATIGSVVTVPLTANVAADGTVTFSVTLTAPANLTNVGVSFQMSRTGLAAFPAPTVVNVVP